MRAHDSNRLMRVDTKPAAKLLEAVGSPQSAYRAVHVTGSKGKGSISALVGAGLAASGARVGVYGSPHVERVNERVTIAGACIGDDALASSLDEVLSVRERLGVLESTWFDVVSSAGLLAFRNAGIEWAVVEVGLGGRKDSTNVLNAPVALISNISLEHQDIIGPTIRDIAYEKAGIISRGSQPIVGMPPTDALAPIFREEAIAVGAREPLFIPPMAGTSIVSHNLALARAALRAALPDCDAEALLTDDAAADVLKALPGRMEVFQIMIERILGGRKTDDGWSTQTAGLPDTLDVTLDGTHVAESVARVVGEMLKADARKPVVLIALGIEKDAPGICAAISSIVPPCTVVTAVANSEEYMPVEVLSRHAVGAGLQVVKRCENPEKALEVAVLESVLRDTRLVVIGSLHLAGKLRPLLVGASIDKRRSSA